MAALAYPPHPANNFSFGRQPSQNFGRRQSFHSAYGGQPQVAFPYNDQHAGMYSDQPSLHGESYPKPSYQIYAPPERLNRHLSAYDDMEIRDPYYPEERHISPGMHSSAVSHGSIPHRQRRRSSSVSFDMRAPPMDTYRRLSSRVIKFKRKGAFRSGLTIGDAQANARLSGNDSYTFHDFNTDARGRINLKIRWAGYPTLTYNIPLDGYGDRVNLETLARRTARSIVHFLQTNIIPVPWDRVEMLRLEEITPGTWQPVLAVR